MTSQDGSPPASPPGSQSDGTPIPLPRVRSPDKFSSTARPFSEVNLPFRRSNASLSAIFSSTATLNSAKRASTPPTSRIPSTPQSQDSIFSSQQLPKDQLDDSNPYRSTIVRSFAPHVAVLSSQDTDELLAQKGFVSGFLQILRPYGENVQGKVTVRDSNGASKSWDDFAIRFVKFKDGLEGPRAPERKSTESRPQNINGYLDQHFPTSSARLRTGGDIAFVEDVVAKHLNFYETQFSPEEEDYFLQETSAEKNSPFASAFHILYLRRLLSGLPLSPHESFSHPVACVIVISSRNPDPIEELRQLYADTNTGDQRMPQWVNNDYLRYYVLLHDEEHDDVQRSMSLFDQMKRHFGIHCYLLRIRSTQCVPSDDDCVELPPCQWLAAAEELAEIDKREKEEDDESLGPFLFESDEASIKSFVRELVTQSVIPVMERLCASWNDQVAAKKRSIGGRFLSLSKKWTFGSSRNSSSSNNTSNSSGSNYDSLQGFYRPDTPEAILRKLGDYAFMLRDFKLAHSTYELVRTDYSNDKAWKYYAGANEMCVITNLLSMQPLNAKSKSENIDQLLDTAVYSYATRCASPFYALRTLAVCIELLALRGGAGADDASRWASRISELGLVGIVGHALFAERVAACFSTRIGTGSRHWGSRRRKSALWNVIAAQDWIKLEKNKQAERCLREAFRMYHVNPRDPSNLTFDNMQAVLENLRDEVLERKGTIEAFGGADEPLITIDSSDVGSKADQSPTEEKPDIKKHRQSLIGVSTAPDLAKLTQKMESQQ